MINALYFVVGAFLRRWYGGMLEAIPILRKRSVQTICMIATLMTIYVTDYSNWKNWLFALLVSLWLQFEEISRGHGACFDIGRGEIDESIIKRYNERWYHIPCDYCAGRGYFVKYGVAYDFMYMTLRYTSPMIPMAIIDCKYILLGLSISLIYSLCWELYEHKPSLFSKFSFISGPTQLAEIIFGGVFFMGCHLIG